MKLIAIARVKNEIDIVEAFVRHNVRHVDKLVVLDDASTDGTYEVLRSLRDGGLPLLVLRETAVGNEQSRSMTDLLHMAVHQLGADWVVPIDADEFIEPEEGTDLPRVLSELGATPAALAWSNFVWRPEDEHAAELNPVLRLRWRLPAYSVLTKRLVPARLVARGNVTLAPGNHAVLCEGQEVPARPIESIALCHFPIRSLAQYAGKIAIGYLKYAARPHWDGHTGWHYIGPFRLLTAGLDHVADAMESQSRRYSLEDSAPSAGAPREALLRYLGGPLTLTPRHIDVLGNVLLYAEALAKARAREAEENESLGLAFLAATPDLPSATPQERALVLRNALREVKEGKAAIDRMSGDNALLESRIAFQESRIAFLESRNAALERERVELRETIYAQSALLSSRTFRLAQALHRRLARTGLPTSAIADRLAWLRRRVKLR